MWERYFTLLTLLGVVNTGFDIINPSLNLQYIFMDIIWVNSVLQSSPFGINGLQVQYKVDWSVGPLTQYPWFTEYFSNLAHGWHVFIIIGMMVGSSLDMFFLYKCRLKT